MDSGVRHAAMAQTGHARRKTATFAPRWGWPWRSLTP